MNPDQRYSDEFLNAFVDNQLDPEEKSRAYADLSRDAALNHQVCELRKLHDLVQLAYRDPPAPPVRAPAKTGTRRPGWRFGVAATVLLTLGVALGTQIRFTEPTATPTARQPLLAPSTLARHASPPATDARVTQHQASPKQIINVVKTEPAAVPVNPEPTATSPESNPNTIAIAPAFAPATANETPPRASAADAKMKVLIHLARDDHAQLNQALDEIEGVLKHYRAIRESAHVEVVVNGKGLELVRADKPRFADRILQLQREYNNLTFAACQNTIDRLKREQGITVRLLPGVTTIDSGMAEITRRQNQGWTYLQV